MRRIAAFVLSLLTLIGGHCLNRRWDRALFFAATGLAIPIMPWIAFWVMLLVGGRIGFGAFDGNGYPDTIGVIVLALISAVIAARDAGRPATMPRNSAMGALAGVVLSVVLPVWVGSYIYSLWAAPSYEASSVTETETAIAEQEAAKTVDASIFPDIASGNGFRHRVHLGGDWSLEANEPPPHGMAHIVGTVTYQGEPASGVVLDVTLDGRYRARDLRTDEQGRFALSVPAGAHQLNTIVIRRWSGKPKDGRFVVISGREPRYDVPYHGTHGMPGEPLTVEATTQQTEPVVHLRIQPALTPEWPPRDGQPPKADDTDHIRWSPAEDASRYLVRFSEVRIKGNRQGSTPVAYYPVDNGTELPLARVGTAPDANANNRYKVEIYAFDEQDRLITQTADSFAFDEHNFVLDGKTLVEERRSLSNRLEHDAEYWEGLHDNRKRLDAAETLIEESLFDTATVLLDRVDPQYGAAGEAARMRGYLHASQGQCEQAEHWFAQAKRADPEICISSCYRAKCPVEEPDA